MKQIIFLESARSDLKQERDYYQALQPGLGTRFIQEVRLAITKILDNPEAMQVLKHNIRRWPVRGFPHGILYRIEPNQIIITAVFHPSLHPDKWMDRKY